MRTYSQLTQIQRYQIYALLKMGQSQSEIARGLGVHKSTISREMQRNTGKRGYRPKQAQQKALEKARLSGWDEKRIIQLMIDQAGRDRDIAMPYKEMNP